MSLYNSITILRWAFVRPEHGIGENINGCTFAKNTKLGV